MTFIGKSIFPNTLVLKLIDTKAIRDAGGYDDTFNEFVLTDGDGDGIGESPREANEVEVKVLGQVTTRMHERLWQAEHGQVPETPNLELTFHFKDLVKAGLVEADGRPKIQIGTRLAEIRNKQDTETIISYPNPPGMFCTAARPSGFLGKTRNLWVCTFSDRAESEQEPPRTQV